MVRPRKKPGRTKTQDRRGRPIQKPNEAGKKLDAIRAALGLTTSEFCALINMTAQTYSAARKKDKLSTYATSSLAKFASVNPDYLAGTSEEMFLTSSDVPALDKVRFAAQAHILTAFCDALTDDEKEYAAKLARHFD